MIIAMRALQYDLTDVAPSWACNQLEVGKNTRHLSILAGLSALNGRWEIEDICDRAFDELGIRVPCPNDGLILYALELALAYQEGSIQKDFFLRTMCQLCIDTGYAKSLYPFYLLRWTWDDLKTQTFSYYEEKATRENFNDLLFAEINKLIEQKPNISTL